MAELLQIPKKNLEKLLKSVNKISESCVIKSDSNGIYTVCSSTDNTVILYARSDFENSVKNTNKINIISIKKLMSGLECLGEENEFSLEYDSNHIKCSNKTGEEEITQFKYHLVDDSIIQECPIDINKISSLNFDTEFIISLNKIRQIMQGYSFASDVTKIYFYTKNSKVFAEINDKTLQNVDNLELKISDSFLGSPMEVNIPINAEVFKNLATCKSDIKVKFNSQFKVFIFQNKDIEDIDLKYIVSALVK